MDDAPAIELRDVWFSYDDVPALQAVDFRVDAGQFVCVIGPNGGGKTTLLKLMLGLLTPQRGEVRVLGLPPQRARAKVGYVPQHVSFDPRFPVSVMDVAMMGRLGASSPWGAYRKADRQAAAQALEDVGLLDQRNRPFSTLSGGQQQRALIARAMAGQPEMLLLDEPTAGLDVGAGGEFHGMLARLAERLTVVLVSHDVGFVAGFVGKVLCVQRTVSVHPTAELTGELVRELYERDVRLVLHDHDCLQRPPEEAGT